MKIHDAIVDFLKSANGPSFITLFCENGVLSLQLEDYPSIGRTSIKEFTEIFPYEIHCDFCKLNLEVSVFLSFDFIADLDVSIIDADTYAVLRRKVTNDIAAFLLKEFDCNRLPKSAKTHTKKSEISDNL